MMDGTPLHMNNISKDCKLQTTCDKDENSKTTWRKGILQSPLKNLKIQLVSDFRMNTNEINK